MIHLSYSLPFFSERSEALGPVTATQRRKGRDLFSILPHTRFLLYHWEGVSAAFPPRLQSSVSHRGFAKSWSPWRRRKRRRFKLPPKIVTPENRMNWRYRWIGKIQL